MVEARVQEMKWEVDRGMKQGVDRQDIDAVWREMGRLEGLIARLQMEYEVR